ncbi:unnamed protein product [Effrenium voratum]|nr:unnamed protein product [Effrenium voratum]
MQQGYALASTVAWRFPSALQAEADVDACRAHADPASLSQADVKRCLKEYGVTEYEASPPRLVELLGRVEGFLPMVGSWEQRRHGKAYTIRISQKGQLCWEGSHITGEDLLGVLIPEDRYLRAELFISQERIGSVRLRHGPDWNSVSLSFKTSSFGQWGAEVVALRTSQELRVVRPPWISLQLAPSGREREPGPKVHEMTSVTALAELAPLSIPQLKECLQEYGVSQYGHCCNQRESLVELLSKVEAALPLLGRWEYGRRKSYDIRRLSNGLLKWEGPHSRGGMLSGVLEDEDGWYSAHLTTNQNEAIGAIRLRHGPKWNEVTSNFRSHTMTEWGSDIIAERVGEEEPRRRPVFEESEEEEGPVEPAAELSAPEVKQCLKGYGVTKFDHESKEELVELLAKVEASLPLLGTWEHGRHKRYEVQHTEDGHLLWEGPHILGGSLVGVLYEDQEWLRAELLTCKEESELVGSVRVSHGPEWNEMTLKFMASNSGHWGEEIVAKRVSKEQTVQRPKVTASEEEMLESQYWQSLEVLSQALRVEHAALPALERRARSWARSVAFAQMTLGMRGVPMRGEDEDDFVIWILGATREVEVSLAEQGFFKDMNWLDRAPTTVYIIGDNLLEELIVEEAGKPKAKEPQASVTKDDAATYVVVYSRVFVRDQPSIEGKYVGDLFEGTEVHGREEGGWLRLDSASAELCARLRRREGRDHGPFWVLLDGKQLGLGVLLERKGVESERSEVEEGAAFLPAICSACYEEVPDLVRVRPPHLAAVLMPSGSPSAEDPPQGVIPREVLELLAPELPVVVSTRAARRESAPRTFPELLPQVRCPFSANAGDPSLKYDDNGWIFAVKGAYLSRALQPDPECEKEKEKVKTMFWGIVDLKYDSSKPIFERIRVLETGDGRISKFSGDGAPIQKKFEEHYQLQEQEAALQTYNFISKDKKLTHDLFEATGYGHIIPSQVCFPRIYYPGLASHICAELGLSGRDLVVLKLCNRSRAAGVMIIAAEQMDGLLQELLELPPAEPWFRAQLFHLENSAADFNVARDSHEDHVRHWWANESPSFVAERCCSSMPILRQGRLYDGTMRVCFALRRRKGASETLTPEDIEVDWLGGYWKLPSADMNSNLVRERIISQAKTGTAPVKPYILTEIYAALSAALQQLFGAAEFTSARLAEQYRSQPELAAYLTARCAMSMREPEQRLQGLRDVERSTMRFTSSPAKSCVQSFVHRAHGVLIARGPGADRWKLAQEHFDKAIEVYPTNSNALSLLGICALELGQLQRALILMNKSLLLDSDFRAPYVNLGVAYLRLAVSEEGEKAQDLFFRAIEISEACLIRHPASPQCNYHIGVACAQLFFLERDPLTPAAAEFRRRSRQELLEARQSAEARRRLSDWQEAQARGTARKQQAPWLSVDDKTLQAVEAPMPPAPKPIKLPEYVGWRLFFWRV